MKAMSLTVSLPPLERPLALQRRGDVQAIDPVTHQRGQREALDRSRGEDRAQQRGRAGERRPSAEGTVITTLWRQAH
jgi:hypothetical protein